MKGTLWYVLAAAVVAGAAGCDDEGGTTGPQAKALDFTLSAPTEIATKGFVDIEVRVTDAVLVNYPLTVTFEEANQDQSFAVINTVLLQKPEDTIARSHEDAARDPLYRVTICEAGQAAKLCVSKTVQVDVLDFP